MMKEISYYAECDIDYTKAVRACETLSDLIGIVEKFRPLSEDAYPIVSKMNEKQFAQFCQQRHKFKPSPSWMKKYGAVLLPKIILEVGLVACRFGIPWGTAYNRLKTLKKLPKV